MVIKKNPSSTYHSLIIRAWQEHEQVAKQSQWRFRVHDLKDDDQQGFASLDALLAFLQTEFGSEENGEENP